jgi:hypothetical protein
MKRWFSVSSLLTLSLAVVVPASSVLAGGTIVVPQQRKLRELVRTLGAPEFHLREQASRELFQIGLPAKQALLEGAKDPDLEVRRRCRELLPEIIEADRQAKLAAFIADVDGKQQHDLPGWERYRKIAGEDTAARRLFVEIQKGDCGFLRDVDHDLDHAGEQCANQCQALFQRQFTNRVGGNPQVGLAEIAPLMLVAADPRVRIPDQQRYLFFSILQYHPTSRNILHSRDASPFKKIVLAWIERQTDDETALQQAFYLLNNLEIKEGLDFTLKTIRDKKPRGILLATALTTVGKLGDPRHVEVLEPFLADQTMIGNFNLGTARGTTQVRDAALAMMVRLTKQSHKDYGFAVSQLNNDHLMAYANFLGFGNDELRNKALGKWKEWKAAQKK